MNSELSETGKNSPPRRPSAGIASAPTNEPIASSDHREPVPQRPADDALVAIGLAVEPVVEPREQRATATMRSLDRQVRIRPVGREHRVERERHEQRDEHRAGDRQRERRHPLLRDAAHERDRARRRRRSRTSSRRRPGRSRTCLRAPPCSGPCPCSTCRTMFSRTTIASSIRMPIASDRPSSDIVFSVKPNASTATNDAITETGSARPVMTVERQEFRKRNTVSTVSARALDERPARWRPSWSRARRRRGRC